MNENFLCVLSGKCGVRTGTCASLSETECEKYVPSRVEFLMLGGRSDSMLYYVTHNRIFASL